MRDVLAWGLALGRGLAEGLLVDAALFQEVVGETEDAEGRITPDYRTVYEGPCAFRTSQVSERPRETVGATVTVQRYTVKVPVGAFRPQIGHLVTVLTAEHDPQLVGRTFRVAGLHHATAATTYRLAIEEVL